VKHVGDITKEFFELPMETKRRYAYGGTEMHGWMALEQER